MQIGRAGRVPGQLADQATNTFTTPAVDKFRYKIL
jgi:hypothetical protein